MKEKRIIYWMQKLLEDDLEIVEEIQEIKQQNLDNKLFNIT